MKRIGNCLTVFLMGGGLYCCLEVLWRGFTHWSMAPVGGLCTLLIYCIGHTRYSLCKKMLLCGVGITVIEGIGGVIFNIVLGMHVWDYSMLPFNFYGQVCLLFTGIWIMLSYPAMKLLLFLDRYIFA